MPGDPALEGTRKKLFLFSGKQRSFPQKLCPCCSGAHRGVNEREQWGEMLQAHQAGAVGQEHLFLAMGLLARAKKSVCLRKYLKLSLIQGIYLTCGLLSLVNMARSNIVLRIFSFNNLFLLSSRPFSTILSINDLHISLHFS